MSNVILLKDLGDWKRFEIFNYAEGLMGVTHRYSCVALGAASQDLFGWNYDKSAFCQEWCKMIYESVHGTFSMNRIDTNYINMLDPITSLTMKYAHIIRARGITLDEFMIDLKKSLLRAYATKSTNGFISAFNWKVKGLISYYEDRPRF